MPTQQTPNLNRLDLNDIQIRNQHLGFDAQIRQSYRLWTEAGALSNPVLPAAAMANLRSGQW